MVSRLARLAHDHTLTTEIDNWLEHVQEKIIREGNEALWSTFLPFEDLRQEVRRFNRDQKQRPVNEEVDGDQNEDVFDDYETLKNQRKIVKKRLSSRRLIRLQLQGIRSFPDSFYDTLDTVQPTSVPAERAFSKARMFRRYNQERQSDERFTKYLFLKDVYAKNKPWVEFLENNSAALGDGENKNK